MSEASEEREKKKKQFINICLSYDGGKGKYCKIFASLILEPKQQQQQKIPR